MASPNLPLTMTIGMPLDAIVTFGGLVRARAPFAMPDVRKGHHADEAAAKSAGLRGPVAYSLHYYAFAALLLEQAYGHQWTNGGELDMAFLRPVCAGDSLTLTIGAREVQRLVDESGDRDRVQVDVHNQLNELVAAGSAAIARSCSAAHSTNS